jgi:hypothetical protein
MRKSLLYVTGKEDKMGRKRRKNMKILFGRRAMTRPLAICKIRFEDADKITLTG